MRKKIWPNSGSMPSMFPLALLPMVACYSSYRFKIPNGDRVPCPDGAFGCDKAVFDHQPASVCSGVGHESCTGGAKGYRMNNVFGADFRAAGMQWTKDVCEKDSGQKQILIARYDSFFIIVIIIRWRRPV